MHPGAVCVVGSDVRLQGDGGVVVRERPSQIAQVAVGVAPAVEKVGIAGIEVQGLAVLSDGTLVHSPGGVDGGPLHVDLA